MSEAGTRVDLKAIVLIAYLLFILALSNGVTAIAGAVLLYIKRDDARGTAWESHVRNLLQVFWITLVLIAVALAAFFWSFSGVIFSLIEHGDHQMPPEMMAPFFVLVPVLWLGGGLYLLWYLYRTIRGLLRALEGQAY